MPTTPRSKPRPDCRFCGGFGLVIVSRDPDVDDDCICTDPREESTRD